MIDMPLYNPGKETPDETQELIEGLKSFEGGGYDDPTMDTGFEQLLSPPPIEKDKSAVRSPSKTLDRPKDSKEFAKRMILDGIMSVEKVSKLSGLSMADVQELSARISMSQTRKHIT